MEFKQLYSKYFLAAPTLNRLIILNVVFFIFFLVLGTITFLFKTNVSVIINWLDFTHNIYDYLLKPWSIITYSFLHQDIWHLLFNMLFLYFFGGIFLNIHPGRRFLNVYFLGVIFGALLMMLSYNLFPVFAETYKSGMIGASAGVSAIMVAATVQSPNYTFRLLFIPVNLKLWWITVFFILKDVVSIQIGNSGGHLAHLGGALIGYIYMKQLQKGNDIGAPVGNTMDWFVDLFKPKQKVKMKTVHKRNVNSKKAETKKTAVSRLKGDHQKEIDAILDKISKSGYESLSKKEKDFLFKAGKNN